MEQANYWLCDNCDAIIENPEKAWVEWLVKKDLTGRYIYLKNSLRIVHSECRYEKDEVQNNYKAVISSNSFVNFQGTDGLMDLLACIAEDKMPKEEVLEMIKRIHIPNYELARPYFSQAASLGIIDAGLSHGYYCQKDLLLILDFFKQAR